MDRLVANSLFQDHGIKEFRWISGDRIEVAQWVRMRYLFDYCHKANNQPMFNLDDAKQFLSEYEHVAVIHLQTRLEQPELLKEWVKISNMQLSKLERDLIEAGHEKTFLLFLDKYKFSYEQSLEIESNEECFQKHPSPEALGIDVKTTIKDLGFKLKDEKEGHKLKHRFAFILIE